MAKHVTIRAIRVGVVSAIFAVGFFCGSLTERRAEAQLSGLENQAMQKAAQAGGPLGSAVKLGQAITEMQQEVDGLQKNLGVLKSVKTSLGG